MTSSLITRRIIGASFLFVVALLLPAAAQEQRRGFYTPPAAGTLHAVEAVHGMVVAQERTAAQIGADILKRGGNAVDAAVATGFAMAVAYPRAGNIGGGGFMVIHLADRGEDIAFDYPRRRRQAGSCEIARFRARHRCSRHGRRAYAGAGKIWLGEVHACRA